MNSLRLGENKEYQAIREKVSEVETALAVARGKYTTDSPRSNLYRYSAGVSAY